MTMAYASSTAPGATSNAEDVGKLLLRVVLGLLILAHGIAKLKDGAGFVLDVVEKAGLPAALGYLVYVGEVVAPLLLIIGLFTRAAAAIVAINMLAAVLLVSTNEIFTMSKTGGWALELEGIYLAAAIAVALLGAGRYSVAGANGRWN
jgi:putative oxidoreductase